MPISPSTSPPTTIEVLLHEIEATPKEHWAALLDNLRQFRQNIPPIASTIVDAEQAQKNQAAIDLLDSWLDDSEDAAEHQQTWDFLKTALDEDRLSDRLLFP
jgi:3-methyladenine DNA glycosylase Tag